MIAEPFSWLQQAFFEVLKPKRIPDSRRLHDRHSLNMTILRVVDESTACLAGYDISKARQDIHAWNVQVQDYSGGDDPTSTFCCSRRTQAAHVTNVRPNSCISASDSESKWLECCAHDLRIHLLVGRQWEPRERSIDSMREAITLVYQVSMYVSDECMRCMRSCNGPPENAAYRWSLQGSTGQKRPRDP